MSHVRDKTKKNHVFTVLLIRRGLELCCLPYMQPKMHCKVDGKLFAAVIDRQKTDISLTLREGLPGMTLDSGAIRSSSALPEPIANLVINMCYS